MNPLKAERQDQSNRKETKLMNKGIQNTCADTILAIIIQKEIGRRFNVELIGFYQGILRFLGKSR